MSKASVILSGYLPKQDATLRTKDSRLSDRFNRIISKLQESPGKSFPSAFQERADLVGFYRFIHNERIAHTELIQEACATTAKLLPSEETVIAVHDTTSFDFTGSDSIEGLGRLTRGKVGFFGHFCIGITLKREIIGLLGLETWARTGQKKKKRINAQDYLEDTDRESFRWTRLVQQVHELSEVKMIHVADREADDYGSFSDFKSKNIRFVFRSNYNRKIIDELYPNLKGSLQEADIVCERSVKVSSRKQSSMPTEAKRRPPRKQRNAQLSVAAKTVEVRKPMFASSHHPLSLVLNFVRVFEANPPDGESPIEWILITNEPISTPEDLMRIVDIYQARWTIDTFHSYCVLSKDFYLLPQVA